MWHVAEVLLRTGNNFILETHFYRPQSEEIIRELVERYGASPVQIFCHAPLPELQRRHDARVASGKRPGIDRPFVHAEMPPTCCFEPLDLGTGVPLLQLDTTQPGTVEQALEWLAVQFRKAE